MTTLTYTTRTPSSHARALPGSAWLPGGRMIRAEFMKQARRRGLMIAAAVLTVGAVIAYFAVEEALHLHNPGQYSAAGGTHGLVNADFILAVLGAVVAILLGASAGAADVTAGVFRNLVTTGRSRAALFLARIPAGVALSIALRWPAMRWPWRARSCSPGPSTPRPTGSCRSRPLSSSWPVVAG
jgi:hypothetical protein